MTYKNLIRIWQDKWFDFIRKHPNKKWHWGNISRNPNLRLDMIENSPELPWNLSTKGFSLNPNLTWDDVIRKGDDYWCWTKLSQNTAIKLENIIIPPQY